MYEVCKTPKRKEWALAKQDEWTRITLRLPPELHGKLTESAGVGSLNAEIVERLDRSYYVNTEYNFLSMLADSTFILNHFPPGLAVRIQASAEEHGRSVEEEVIQALDEAYAAQLPGSLTRRIKRRASETGRTPHEEIVQALEAAFPTASETDQMIEILESLFASPRQGKILEQFESDPATKRLRQYLDYLKSERDAGRSEGARARLKEVFSDSPQNANGNN